VNRDVIAELLSPSAVSFAPSTMNFSLSAASSSCRFLHCQVILWFRFLDFVQRFLNLLCQFLDFVQFLILIRVSLYMVCLYVIAIGSILFNFQFELGFSVYNLFECYTSLN
jgi:hypothetical protein